MKVKLIKNLKKKVLLVDGLPTGKELDMKFLHETLFPKGDWERLNTLKDLTESDSEELVERYPKSPIYGFRNYRFYSEFYLTAKESFLSALGDETFSENTHVFVER